MSDEIVENLYDRILGRVALFDIVHPTSLEIIVSEGEEINEDLAREIENAGIDEVVYDEEYRDTSSIEILLDAGIKVRKL